MSQSTHTYGPTCHLAQTVTFSGSKDDDDIPDLKAHFFYCSPLPIDDPLSAVPVPTASDSTKHPLRPFSAHDNNALEEAWLDLASGKDKKHHKKSKASEQAGKHTTERRTSTSSSLLGKLAKKRDSSPHSKGSHTIGVSSPAPVRVATGKHDKRHARVEAAKPSRTAHLPSAATYSSPENANSSGYSIPNGKSTQNPEASNTSEINSQVQPGSTGLDSHGNPYNPNCDDPHHVPLDFSPPACCVNMEVGIAAHHHDCIINVDVSEVPNSAVAETSPKSNKVKNNSKQSAKVGAIGEAQGDGADERPSKTQLQDADELASKEHRAFVRHEDSKDHQDFEKHLKTGHSGHYSDLESADLNLKKFKLTKRRNSRSFEAPPEMGDNSDPNPSKPLNQAVDTGTTGQPFLKFPARKGSPRSRSFQTSDVDENESHNLMDRLAISPLNHADEPDPTETQIPHTHGCKVHKNTKEHTEVPVGISMLHLVKLPALQMQPIYWSPVHDVAVVTRGTWFYKDTMYPVEPAVANQLESGYRELRPWSRTWADELSSALEVGAAGEEKIAHPLWPKEIANARSNRATDHYLSTDPSCAARCFQGEASAEGTVNPDEKSSDPKVVTKKYSAAQVIYKDAQNAFILKPNLQPSSYYGRKPLQKIKKGTAVGIHVTRGFDWKSWEKLHPSNRTNVILKVEENAPIAGNAAIIKKTSCPACRSQEERPKVTDLVLVIHGIGQKLSERVESFHFTHAINAFRRSINVEVVNESVQSVLRDDMGGIMVLPVNWRSNLSFDDGGRMKDEDRHPHNSNFSLKDITLDTLPALRNVISDVMLDIPFYMSHHKPKIIQAVISEANRVYRLWCKNNPEFHHGGRVHIIAHSLGSAMAVEILSKQPTSVPKLDVNGKRINTKHFDFNTKNLFFAGSPAGFFLLLEKGKLIPRRGQRKPGAEHSDEEDKNIAGDVGTFGCMAVDNIYNIMHPNDPIAYRLNATVDPQYAASLKPAQVPSATTGFFESIGNAVRSLAPGASSSNLAIGQISKPAAIARLPSQLELEVHDFTREEIAEKKFYLLNDYGQVDWRLSSGNNPLEIQYVTMLSAHSSYWLSSDFVRMIVTEIGREPGKSHGLPNMRAVKNGHKP